MRSAHTGPDTALASVKLVPVCDSFHVLEFSFLFVESVLDQLLDCFDRAFGIIAVRFHLNLASLRGCQREHAHDAASVRDLTIFRKIHLS